MNNVIETNKKQAFTEWLRHAMLRLPLKQQIQFIKQFGILMKAGVPMFSSLYLLKEQSKGHSLQFIMTSVIKDVENGQYLANALGKFKKLFGDLTINMIAIGEISGTLSDNLDHLALTLKKRQALRRKVVGASVYPIFIIIATLGIAVMLTVFVFPKIIPVFKSINYELPWTTKFLIWISDTAQSYGLYLLAGFVVLVVGAWLLLRVKKIHFWYDNALVRVPLIKQLVITYNVANICRTMGLLLNSGTTVIRAFQITADTTPNLAYKKALDAVAQNVSGGEIISTNFRKYPTLFPVASSQMVTVAESTGKLSETFSYLADVYEEEMDDLTKNLSTTLEPMLLIFMGVLVGFIAISIITPIYGITQHLTPK